MRLPFSFWSPGVWDPTKSVTSAHFYRCNYSASPWTGTTSLGTSGSNSMSEATHPPTTGATINGLTPADFVTNELLTGTNLSVVIGSSSTVSCWGWALFIGDTATTDPGTAAGRLTMPALFTDGNEVISVAFSSGGVSLAAFDTGAGSTSVISPAGTGSYHLGIWKLIDQTSLNVAVDSGGFVTQSWTGKSLHGTRSGLVRCGCRGTGAGNFLDGRIADVCVMIGTPTAGDVANVKSYINHRYGTSYT